MPNCPSWGCATRAFLGPSRGETGSLFGSDAILMTDQLAESVFVESIQQHSVPIGERLLPPQRRMPYH